MTSSANLVTESAADLTANAEESKTKTFKEMILNEKLVYIREVITVEPLLGLYLMAAIICLPALQTLEFEKTCRANLNVNISICNLIRNSEFDNFTDINDNITVLISNMHSWQNPIQNIVPLILVLFIGSYSDRHKYRKPFLLLPVIGELFAVCGCILSVVFMDQWTLEFHGFLQTVVPSFFGGPTVIIMAVYAYIADVSTTEMRTLRIGIIQIVVSIIEPLSLALSGVLFTYLNYIGVFLIAAVLYTIAICYGYFCIKDQRRKPDEKDKKNILLDICDPTNAIDTFKILVKKNAENDRFSLILILIIVFTVIGIANGEVSVFFLYVQNVFKWTGVEYSYYLTVNTVVRLIGTTAGLALFTKVFNFRDITILLITFVDKIVSNLLLGVVKVSAILYVGAVIGLLTGISNVALRSLATKVVAENDLAKALSLFGICDAIGASVFVPFYNQVVFVNTFKVLPATFLFCGCLMFSILIVVGLFMFFKMKNRESSIEEKQEKPDTTIKNDLSNFSDIPLRDVQITHI